METAAAPAEELRVLLVDDEASIRMFVTHALALEGMEADEAADAAAGLQAFEQRAYDAVVLDVMMPGGSGMQLLATLRAQSNVPVVMISAWNSDPLRVVALEAGADDYLAKPFTERELALRIRMAVERRSHASPGREVDPGDADRPLLGDDGLAIDVGRRTVTLDGEPVELTAKEFDLLAYLADHPDQVFDRQQLLRSVWDAEPDWQSVDTVTEHVYRLRQKIEAGDQPARIRTVRGAGYRFVGHRVVVAM